MKSKLLPKEIKANGMLFQKLIFLCSLSMLLLSSSALIAQSFNYIPFVRTGSLGQFDSNQCVDDIVVSWGTISNSWTPDPSNIGTLTTGAGTNNGQQVCYTGGTNDWHTTFNNATPLPPTSSGCITFAIPEDQYDGHFIVGLWNPNGPTWGTGACQVYIEGNTLNNQWRVNSISNKVGGTLISTGWQSSNWVFPMTFDACYDATNEEFFVNFDANADGVREEVGRGDACLFADCDLNGRPDKDNDGIADENDVDKDNDGILNEDEEAFPWLHINANFLGFVDTTNASGTLDISNEWGLAPGTVILEFINVHTNIAGGPNLAVSLTETTSYKVTGSCNVKLQVFHGGNLNVLGRRDGFTSDDGAQFSYIGSLIAGSFQEFQIGNDYYVENLDGTFNNSSGFRWQSNGYASEVTLWSTNQVRNNNTTILIKPVNCLDTDMDGIPNTCDLDSDNDGIPDAVEACGDINIVLENCMLDSDGSGTYPDNDGDGCPDGIEASACTTAPIDTDGDGTPDFLDLDSDGDGCADATESGSDSNPNVNDFPGGYAIPAAMVDPCGIVLENGMITCYIPPTISWIDSTNNDACCFLAGPDKDNDGIIDFQDTDADNDGIPDSLECDQFNYERIRPSDFGFPLGVSDGSLNAIGADLSAKWGLPPGSMLVTVLNASTHPVTDAFASINTSDIEFIMSGSKQTQAIVDQGSVLTAGALEGLESIDGVAYQFLTTGLDTGIALVHNNDQYYVFNTGANANNSFGTYVWESVGPTVAFKTICNDVIASNVLRISLRPICCPDTDGDGYTDEVDLDSDNDGIPDAIEACGDITLQLEDCRLDNNGDATYPDYNEDGCPDGLVDSYCASAPIDTDGDGIPDYKDLDSDNDGCPDASEAGTDANPNVNTGPDYGSPAAAVDSCGLVLDGTNATCMVPDSTDWIDSTAFDACLTCEFVDSNALDICIEIDSDPNHPLATLDCDNGGIDNYTECESGEDPLDPLDDCEAAINEEVDICALLPKSLVITGVGDGPLTGGTPKFLELFVLNNIPDLGVYGVESANNGGGTTSPEFTFPAGTPATAGTFIYIANNSAAFTTFFGFTPDYISTAAMSQNGDDALVLYENGTIIDVMGDPNLDGTGAPWEYTDGWIHRNNNTSATTPFLIGNWTPSGRDVYDGASTNATSSSPFPVGSYLGGSHPLADQDCDNGGVDNQTECDNNGDPSEPSDDCEIAIIAGVDICLLIGMDSTHVLADQDCDNGGIDNYTECMNGGDPAEPSDDCDAAIDGGVDICAILTNDPNNPLATIDCDNGGVDNQTECDNNGDPADPSDDCDIAIVGGVDICLLIGTDSTHVLATLDCDMGGVDNYTECENGGDPSEPSDDCDIAILPGVDICAILTADPDNPLATADCDMGGVDNQTECDNGGDPADPSDDCDIAILPGVDICAILTADPNNPLATADCDMGGVDNQTECDNRGDPADPSDDCDIAILPGIDICAILTADPNNPLATADCDMGGVDNQTECDNNGDPADPSDDCDIAILPGVDICAILTADPDNPLATADCDMGGVDNQTECDNGGDPSDPSDDCDIAILPGVDICAILTADPNNPLATADCDMGGVDNQTECDNGGDPADPSDDCDIAILPGVDICAILTADPDNPLATADCDMGGVDNQTECDNNGDPADPSDDCDIAIQPGVDICAILTADPDNPLATADCDMGGVDNQTECNINGDPSDPSDDCDIALIAGADICLLIGADPDHPLATLDCDNGGVDNYTECTNGGDPTEPSDDCDAAINGGVDICAILTNDPNNPLGTLDCDMGGVDNQTECDNNGDPSDPIDDCDIAITPGVDICAILTADPDNPLATADCDMGGVDNQTECDNGGDPSDPSDDCDIALIAGADICILIGSDSTHVLATLDCDDGGVDNYTECANGGDPANPNDDCEAAVVAEIDICATINGDPNHPWASLDCDNGGVINIVECDRGGDANDPSDDLVCPPTLCGDAYTGDIDICMELTNDPNHPIGTLDCDGDGVTNADECSDNTDPLDPCDFDDTSITLPVTADQGDCINLCPDLSPITTILPGNIAGPTNVCIAVEIFELNGYDTDGSQITIRMPSDPRLVFVWLPNETTCGILTYNNPNWNYLGDNGIVHTWTFNGPSNVIPGGTSSRFGFNALYDPQNTDGQTTITATIIPRSGGECNFLNNTDSERLVYFE